MNRKRIMLLILIASFVIMLFQIIEVNDGSFYEYFGPILQFLLMIALYIAIIKEK